MLDRTTPPDPSAVQARIRETNLRVGRRLRQARIWCDLSQEKLAAAIGVTFQQLQKYEKGVNRISCGCLAALAELTGRDITWFFVDEVDDGVADWVVRMAGHFLRGEGLTPYVDEADHFTRARAGAEARRREGAAAVPACDFAGDAWRSRASLIAELEQHRGSAGDGTHG